MKEILQMKNQMWIQVQVNSKKGGFAIIFLQFTHFLQLMDYNSAQMVILDQGSEEMWID